MLTNVDLLYFLKYNKCSVNWWTWNARPMYMYTSMIMFFSKKIKQMHSQFFLFFLTKGWKTASFFLAEWIYEKDKKVVKLWSSFLVSYRLRMKFFKNNGCNKVRHTWGFISNLISANINWGIYRVKDLE